MLGKRKADNQLTPEGAEKDKPARFSDNVENFPTATADEIAKRPPLIAKRRGGQPEIMNPASDQPSDDQTKPPAVVQPVGPAPAIVNNADKNKTIDSPITSEVSDKPNNSDKSDATISQDPPKKPTMELNEEKEDKSDKPAAFKPFDFSSSLSSPFTTGQKSIFSGDSKGFSFSSSPTTSTPFSFKGIEGSPASNIEFKVPTSTPSSLSEHTKAVAAPPIQTTTGEEEENTVFTDTVRVYYLGDEPTEPSTKTPSTETTAAADEKTESTEDKKEVNDTAEEKKEDANETTATSEDKKENSAADDKKEVTTNGSVEVVKPAKKWLERGRGELKLNVQKQENKSRIIVRRERTHQLVINMPLFSNITCEKASDTAIRIVGFNQGPDSDTLAAESYLIRQRSAKNTNELFDAIQKHIATSSPLSFGNSTKTNDENKESATADENKESAA